MELHNPFDQMSLRSRADEILGHFGIPQFAISKVAQSYFEDWRTYHNATHLMDMLEVLRQMTLDAEFKLRVGLLVLYHDVFYKVGRPRGDNEVMSAEWAIHDLELTGHPKTIALAPLVHQGILATITHSLDQIDDCYQKEVALLIDLDLWGLGTNRRTFEQNTERIWYEQRYTQTKNEFRASQKAWATNLLDRPSVYLTKYAENRERQARRNLWQLVQKNA